MNIEKIVNENGFVFKNKTSETYKEKFVLKITADENDADNLTETTEFLLEKFTESSLENFLNVIKVLLKLVNPRILVRNSYYKNSRITEMMHTLTEEDIQILYQYDFSKINPKDDFDFDIHDIEEYSIFDRCSWTGDSTIRAWFPSGDFDQNDSEFVNNCHTLNGVELFYHDAEGNIVEILKEI